MKIVLDLQGAQSHSRRRGIGRYSLLMAKAFAERASRHDVWLMLNGRQDESSLDLIEQFSDLIPRERILVSELPSHIAGCQPGNRQRLQLAATMQANFMAGLRADCIWHSSLFEGWGDNSTAALSAGASDHRHAATLYDLIPLLNPSLHLHDPAYRRWYFRRLALLKRCGLLLAISESSRREAMEHLHIRAEQISVVSGAADPVFRPLVIDDVCWQRWRHDWRLRPGFVLYAGGYDAHKNIDALIAAFAQLPSALRQQHPLVLAGRCDDAVLKRLRHLGRKYRLTEETLIFTRGLDDLELTRLYSACALFIAPSLHEGLGLPVLEAMACGAAVIGSNSTSLPEVIGRSDALFDARSRHSIAAKLHQALTTPGLLEDLRAHARVQSGKFSWEASAGKALAAIEQHQGQAAHHLPRARPRLIYVSPLPPVRSGIADYSARLLRELASHYDIDVVVDQPEVVDPWVEANFPIRSPAWFFEQARFCARILYHLGNSPFHAHMLGMLEQHPGVVMLHDSWLGALRNWMGHDAGDPGSFPIELYHSHGFVALRHDLQHGRPNTLDTFPVNRDVIERALGVIVHSHYAVEQARLQNGAAAAEKFAIVPFLRERSHGDRRVARRLLGIDPDDFVVCSFGMLAPTKLNDRLISAWRQSTLANDARCQLIFVGENHGGEYGEQLRAMMTAAGTGKRIHVTGFVSKQTYADYLVAADVVVQLREASRGETSAAIFDALAQGLPLIVNAHGTAGELPDASVIKLPDQFADDQLIGALEALHQNPEQRQALSAQAKALMQQHHPADVAAHYRDAIEHFVSSTVASEGRRWREQLQRSGANPAVADSVVGEYQAALQASGPRIGLPSIYVDVTATSVSDRFTGIERVVRGVLSSLLQREQLNYRIEPVRLENGAYVRAPCYGLQLLGYSPLGLPASVVQPRADDILLGLDWVADALPVNTALLDAWRVRGVRMFFVVYDLLPVRHPDWFPQGIAAMHADWLQCIGRYAEGLLCISRAVADDLRAWFDVHPPRRKHALALGYFYPGGDVAASRPSQGLPDDAAVRLAQWASAPSFLMVGTIEPRKGHAFVLDAFEQLWARDVPAVLIIVGREGWLSSTLVQRMRRHVEAGKRLVWLEQASDAYLEQIYDHVSALVAASEGEGFGLPLVEAAARGLPVIARDISVFREVSSAFARYFDGRHLDSLVDALINASAANERVSSDETLRPVTWQETTEHLWKMLLDRQHAQWLAPWLPTVTGSSSGSGE